MNLNDINFAWNAISVTLKEFSFNDIKDIAKLAGFDINDLRDLGYDTNYFNNPCRSLLVDEIETYFLTFADERKSSFLNIVIELILSGRFNCNRDSENNIEEQLQNDLGRLGWQIVDKKVLPKEILDLSDLNELDSSSREDLMKAATLLRDGDLGSAILSAYAAVESVIKRVYEDNNLGEIDYRKTFQFRCNYAFERSNTFSGIADQLRAIGWDESSAKQLQKNLKGSLNQAAYVIQSLRNKMSNAHGTRPAIRPLAFDCIKWSEIIIRLLSQPYPKEVYDNQE